MKVPENVAKLPDTAKGVIYITKYKAYLSCGGELKFTVWLTCMDLLQKIVIEKVCFLFHQFFSSQTYFISHD